MKFGCMEDTMIDIVEREASAGEFLEAANCPGTDAWLLVESPRRMVFERYTGQLDEQLLREFSSAVIFCREFEARMEKAYGGDRGFLRIVRHMPSGGDLFVVRKGSALLRSGSGRLQYAEYFREDKSGFLVRECWRLCGVEGR